YDLGTGNFGNVSAWHDPSVKVIWAAGDGNQAFTIERNNYLNCASLLLRGLAPSDVSFYRSGSSLTNLTIGIKATGKTVTLYHDFANAWSGAASVTSGNATVWQAADIAANTYVTAAPGTYITTSLTGIRSYDLGTGNFGNVSAWHDQAVKVIWGAGDSNEAFTIEGNSYQNCGSLVLSNLGTSDVSFYRSGSSFTALTLQNNTPAKNPLLPNP